MRPAMKLITPTAMQMPRQMNAVPVASRIEAKIGAAKMPPKFASIDSSPQHAPEISGVVISLGIDQKGPSTIETEP